MTVTRDYYICKKKRPYPWFWAHMKKYREWTEVRLCVYRCDWCGWYHLSKRNERAAMVKLIVVLVVFTGFLIGAVVSVPWIVFAAVHRWLQ